MSTIAVVNAGSSSLKFALFHAANPPEPRLWGLIDGIGATPRVRLSDPAGAILLEEALPPEGFDHTAATAAMMRVAGPWLDDGSLAAIGHRVVHGGPDYAAPLLVTQENLETLARFIPLAPLHQPHNLAVIRAMLASHPRLPQIACFDTAFHRGQDPLAQAFALPRQYARDGVRRYGFHGISYQYVAGRLKEIAPEAAQGRVIVAHLGNGASLCAMRDGQSVATTMGFTAADGLMMGTRCGAIDPGVLIHMLDHYGMDARGLEDLIYRKSGLLGVSGLSSDMRALRAAGAPEAKEAIALFVYRIAREIGSLAAALRGLDALVFTAGIGENDPATRAEVCARCDWLGLALDEDANRRAASRISAPGSRVAVFVVPTHEELEIAKSAWRIVAGD